MWQSDTIYNSDTLRIEKNGDTIKIESIKWRYRGKAKCDTIVKYQTRSINKTIEITKEVNKLYWWQEVLMWIGGILLVIGLKVGIVWIILHRRI